MVIARLLAAVLALILLFPALAAADEPVLTIDIAGQQRQLTRAQLLADPALETIAVASDIAYGRAMTYRAVPLDRLLAGIDLPHDQVLEAVASDGFVGLLPPDSVIHPQAGGARAYLAIEPADRPWPLLPNGKASAGPFYVVWAGPGAAQVKGEQWPYQVVTLRSSASPVDRWPALAVDPALPADSPVRAGEALFLSQCFACHKLNGAGNAEMGPDLNLPFNPTEYFKPEALKRYIRNPSALRRWPDMQMKGFSPASLSDQEIDLVIAYLAHMAGRKVSP